MNFSSLPRILSTTALSFALVAVGVTSALALGSVRSPHVTKDKLELEYKGYRTGDDRKELNNAQKHVIEMEYGLTDRLKLDIEGAWERESSKDLYFEATEVAGLYELTQPGEYWVDSGIYASYEWTEDDNSPQEISLGLLLQKSYGKITHRANAYLSREVGDDRESGLGVETRYLAQYNYNPYFKPGIEWQAEWGNTEEFEGFDDQAHYVGPAAYGHVPFVEKLLGIGELEYELIYYRGVSDAAADDAVRWTLEYALKF